ncbi:MAG: tape measure protein, partial [Bacteroidales bacterium]|nr:tape measure protein [Bacteroidales bacterium]
MSATIDEKVVEMRFDGRDFEKNARASISTLDKLKQSLKLDGAAKGFENVGAAANRLSLSGPTNAADAVAVKFSYMQGAIMHQFNRIVDGAVDAGKRVVSAFTVDPMKTGFQEYELKMGSIQTIMASTGESLATVNKYLEELNEYSDKTIYSFSDMTTNIGKFTNAGVKLDDAVAAIKGVSNVAAISGANANEASRAMYNFAQALSAGYVKLIDWKSIENANMATVGFKEQLLEAAVAAGTLTKTSDGMYKTLKGHVFNATKNFNEVLQDQWMTTDVLVSTLKDYADETTDIGKKAMAAAQDVKTFTMLMDTLKEAAQSGWTQTWE